MLGRGFTKKKEPVSKADKVVKTRLDKLEKRVFTGRFGVDPETAERVKSLETAVQAVKKDVCGLQPPPGKEFARKLQDLEGGLSRVTQALVKLPKDGETGGLVVKVSRLEKDLGDVIEKLEEQGKFLANLYGLKGDNGRVGQLERVADRLEEKLDKMAWLHFKLLGMALGGGIAGGFLAKLLM